MVDAGGSHHKVDTSNRLPRVRNRPADQLLIAFPVVPEDLALYLATGQITQPEAIELGFADREVVISSFGVNAS